MDYKIQICVALVLLVCSSCLEPNRKDKPNILLINIDDLGWKDVGFMGTAYYETPNIDSLAKQGMVFVNGYAAASNCAPSRACLMTGKWVPRHGIYTVGSSERGDSKNRKLIPIPNTDGLSGDHTVIAEVLQENGYATCHAGKWHLSENPLEFGFDTNIGGGHNGHPKSYYPPYGNVGIESGKKEHLTDLIMEKTMEFLDTVNRPFFLYYSPYAVHTPIQPIDSLVNKYAGKPAFNGQQNVAYATMIENLDRNIGLLVSSLKEKGQFNNSLIIFTSDNGGLYGITQQKPLRAGKGSYYEGGIREPFFFVWNGKIQANTTSDVPIMNLDVFPTLLSAIGVDNDSYPFDGKNVLPILLGNEQHLDRALYWHFPIYLEAYNMHNNENRDSLFRTRPGSVVNYKEWKLHYYFENNEVELYNLAKDIGERNNVALKNPGKRDELLGYLKKWWKETNAPIPKTINPDYIK
ncbi:MAG: sulfatase [Flavobacteriaceae bacterium]